MSHSCAIIFVARYGGKIIFKPSQFLHVIKELLLNRLNNDNQIKLKSVVKLYGYVINSTTLSTYVFLMHILVY